ncbi:MAG: hypothetical protein E7Z94_04545 [Actinomyces ruminicola]|nr:hypothetical protein [Actinomyces ruminicola]
MSQDEADRIGGLLKLAPLWLAHLVLGVIFGVVFATLSGPVYTSTASALVAADTSDGGRSVSSATNIINTVMPTIVQLSTSDSVLSEVAQTTGIDQSELKRAVTVTSSTNSLIITVSATASSAETAQVIAEAEVAALRRMVSELSITPQDETGLSLTDIDAASLPSAPSGPSKARYGAFGGIIGATIGLAVSFLLLRTRMSSDDKGPAPNTATPPATPATPE